MSSTDTGAIELEEMSASNNTNMRMGIRRSMYPEEPVQQSPVGEFFPPDQSRPWSPSSSLRALSVGSPEYSSLIASKGATTSLIRDANLIRETSMEVGRPTSTLLPHQAHGMVHNTLFPTPTGEDAAMARAMIAVISSSSPVHDPLAAQISEAQQSQARSRERAFKPYDSTLAIPSIEAKEVSHGQGMIKRAFSILRQTRSATSEEAQMQLETRPTSNQLLHMISERKRREKLNESFTSLRTLLPPGAKRDKASVLSGAIEYVNSLKVEISNLEEKNRSMERLLLPLDGTDGEEEHASGERAKNIQIIRPNESSSESTQIKLRVIVRVECDMIDLVLHILECLKETRGIGLLSLDASIHHRQMKIPIRWAILTLQIKGSDWDEVSFREAITRAVDEAILVQADTAAT
uniref:Putative transcription factor bHLH041 n=1 Tax=Anthurium amnicola TaxID=1678845 RepID=A0A1D1YS40_9ARAE